MKRIALIFLFSLFAFASQGQKIILGDTQYGSDLVSGWDFTSGWNTVGDATITDANNFDCGTSDGIIKALVEVGESYKCHVKGITGATSFRIYNGGVGVQYSPTYTTGAFDDIFIFTAQTNTSLYFRSIGSYQNTYIETFTLQKVTKEAGYVIRAYDANQPLNIDDECKVWFDGKDASTFTLDGTYVNDWEGKGSLNIHVKNENDDATRPTYDASTGRVTFSSANSTFLQSAAFGSALSQPNTVFVVYKKIGTGYYTNFGTNAGYVAFRAYSDFEIITNVKLTDGVSNLNDNIHVGLFSSTDSEYWINGVSKIKGDAGTRGATKVFLGGRSEGISHSSVSIMEVIVYNADISDRDRDVVTAYLANKWNITATTENKGFVITYECIWLILLLIPNVRRKEEEFKIAA